MARSILHIILAFSVLLSTTGLLVNAHYCQNKLKNLSFFFAVNACDGAHKVSKKQHCPFHPEEKSEKDCCHDTSEYLNLDQEKFQQSFTFKSFIKVYAHINAQPTSLKLISELLYQPTFLSYKPPKLVFDKAVFFQSFLF